MRLAPAVAILCPLLFVSGSASAVQIQCAAHSQMMGLLKQKYQERPLAMGTVNSDRYMQLFVSARGTWTILMTKTDGEACIVAAGENWEKIPQQTASKEPAA